jgi:dTDP-4-dehydrorhamnose reductase
MLQISQRGQEAISKFSGIYHMTAAGKSSWFEFAKAILEEASQMPRGIPWFETATRGQPLITGRVTGITTKEYPTPGRRPAYSVLSNSRLKRDFGLELPAWSSQLRAVFAEDRING